MLSFVSRCWIKETNLLVHSNTDGALRDVKNNTSSSVVVLEGHALVDGGIHLHVNIISSLQKEIQSIVIYPKRSWRSRMASDLEGAEVCAGLAAPGSAELLLKQVARVRSVSKTVRHILNGTIDWIYDFLNWMNRSCELVDSLKKQYQKWTPLFGVLAATDSGRLSAHSL